jgi:succinyl-CoA synthetase beta subunit
LRLFEYEAKSVLRKSGIATSKGGIARSADEAGRIASEIGGEVVLKSQVLSGGRMKAGGVRFATSADDARNHAGEILALEIGGHLPRGVLVESKSAVKKEYYAGIIFDAIAKLPVAIFSDMGGIDIEHIAEEHPQHVARAHFSTFQPFEEFKMKELVSSLGIGGSS